MKLIYIANNRLPTEKAHGVQIAKMCESFVANGVSLELVYPKRNNKIKDDLFSFYNIKNNFKTTKINSWDLVGVIPRIGFIIQSLTFTFNTFCYLKKIKFNGIVYSRDQFSSILLLMNKKIRLVYEIHTLPKKLNFYHTFLLKKVFKIIAISNGLKKDLITHGISNDKIFVAPDGVDLEKFKNIKYSKKELRIKLQLPKDKKIILYAGHLYEWKGVYTLAKAANLLDDDCIVVFVGGTEGDIEKFKKFIKNNNLKNILILGHKKHEGIPLYLKSADILVLPNSGKEKISSHYTSPMKLFEYMASGTPIVASDLPSIREVMNDNNSIFFETDNNIDLACKINNILCDSSIADKITTKSLSDVKNYNWSQRVNNIIKFIEKY